MLCASQGWLISIVMVLLALNIEALARHEAGVKSAIFLSPKFELAPGSVVNKYYYNISFPRGHIALKSFNAEVVDEAGKPIPLHETYLHHWVVGRYYQHRDAASHHRADAMFVRNAGVCENNVLGQYFGLGSETRRTSTYIPDPYGIEIGNPTQIPEGYEERWMLNVHAIDTRGVIDKLGCTECRCHLYNVTVDEYGRPLSPDYKGGLKCCYDQMQCKTREGYDQSTKRSLFLRYTVKWADWDASVFPVQIYIFDVTDTWKRSSSNNSLRGPNATHHCQVEYEVKPCSGTGVVNDDCFDVRRISLAVPSGGYLIYGVAHQHSGGIGSTLYREDGQVLCSSIPTYGEGEAPGNEAGYIVGMSTCYPHPGSIKLSEGEILILESNYSGTIGHTGVMGIFYLLVAESLQEPSRSVLESAKQHMDTAIWALLLLLELASTIAVGVGCRHRLGREDDYEPIVM